MSIQSKIDTLLDNLHDRLHIWMDVKSLIQDIADLGSIKNDFNASSAPDSSFNTAAGWSNGSRIHRKDSDNKWSMYECMNADTGEWLCYYGPGTGA